MEIKELDHDALPDANRCDTTFTVEATMVLNAENGVIHYTVVPATPYQKRYPAADVDYLQYIGAADKTVLLAYLDGRIAGEMRLCRWWNDYGYIEDIVVDAPFRRHGVGYALIERAILWTKARRLPGLMLETQNNNVAACRFYERCGFILSGFDTRLYQSLHPGTEEIALFWYLIFES